MRMCRASLLEPRNGCSPPTFPRGPGSVAVGNVDGKGSFAPLAVGARALIIKPAREYRACLHAPLGCGSTEEST